MDLGPSYVLCSAQSCKQLADLANSKASRAAGDISSRALLLPEVFACSWPPRCEREAHSVGPKGSLPRPQELLITEE